jgi:hypothetical protein
MVNLFIKKKTYILRPTNDKAYRQVLTNYFTILSLGAQKHLEAHIYCYSNNISSDVTKIPPQ